MLLGGNLRSASKAGASLVAVSMSQSVTPAPAIAAVKRKKVGRVAER